MMTDNCLIVSSVRDSKVRFTKNQAGTYDCQVFWIAQPIDPATGKPWLDSKNPDKALSAILSPGSKHRGYQAYRCN